MPCFYYKHVYKFSLGSFGLPRNRTNISVQCCRLYLPPKSPKYFALTAPQIYFVLACFIILSYPTLLVKAQCAAGWAYFANDGVEGQDSCIKLFSVALTYANAQANCVSLGGHLLTVKSSTKDAGLMAAAGALSTSATFMVGCAQVSTATQRGAGFNWIDGTDTANINCGTFDADGCNLWNTGEPKYVGVPVVVLVFASPSLCGAEVWLCSCFLQRLPWP